MGEADQEPLRLHLGRPRRLGRSLGRVRHLRGADRGLPAGALGLPLPLGQLGLRLGSGLRLQDGLGLPELSEAPLAVSQLGRQLVAPPALAVLGVLRRIDLFRLREEGGDFLCQPPLGLAHPIHQLLGNPR